MSNWYVTVDANNNDILHYGVLGMKWGVRRYQNEDGTLTDAGRKKYGYGKQKTGYKLDNAMGFLSKTQPGNRQKEYALQKKMAKNTKGYKSLLKTDIKDLKKQKKINQQIVDSIREKRSPEAAGAFLKDLGYKDTEKGRKEILKLFNSKELRSMATSNQAARLAQISIVGAIGGYFLNKYAAPALGKNILDAFELQNKIHQQGVDRQNALRQQALDRQNALRQQANEFNADRNRINAEIDATRTRMNSEYANRAAQMEREYNEIANRIEREFNEININDIKVNDINVREILG